MTKRDDGGPAFPGEQGFTPQGWNQTWCDGMSLLDWFAGQALAGIMATMNTMTTETKKPEVIAHDAYLVAAAMLAEKRRRESEAKP